MASFILSNLEIIKHGTKIRKKYVVDEEEAQIVRDIFEFYGDGHSLRHIQMYLQEKGAKSRRGKDFGINTLSRMLGNDFYIGTLRYSTKGYDDIVTENAVPAIVPPHLWHNVAERKAADKMKASPRKHKELYALTGKIECAKCGSHFFGMKSGSQQRAIYFEYRYYICSKRKGYRTCDCRKIRKEKLEDLILSEIKKRVLNEHDMERLAREIVAMYNDSPRDIDDEIKRLAKMKKDVENALDTLVEMRLNGEISPAYTAKKSAEKEAELLTINKRLFAMTEQQRHAVTYGSVRAYLDQLLEYSTPENDEVMKLLFDNLVERVLISDESVDIFLNVHPRADFAYKKSSGHPRVELYASVNE